MWKRVYGFHWTINSLRRRRFELLSAGAGPASLNTKSIQEPKQQSIPSLLETLPLEIIAEALSFLRVQDLAHVARTCKKLKQIVNEEVVWRLLCQKYFDCSNVMEHSGMSWKAYFREASKFEWDEDNCTMNAIVTERERPLLSMDKSTVTKTLGYDADVLPETATVSSSKMFTSGCHCIEFITSSNNNNDDSTNYKFAVGLIDCSEKFNYSMSNYGDGETLSSPTSTLNQCFYWSDGQFSDILGASALSGSFDFNTDVDPTFQVGDVIGMVVNMDARCVTFYKNYVKVARYSFAQKFGSNTACSEESADLCMNAALYLFAEGVSVTARHAPFYLYA